MNTRPSGARWSTGWATGSWVGTILWSSPTGRVVQVSEETLKEESSKYEKLEEAEEDPKGCPSGLGERQASAPVHSGKT